jgi:hypothetical protein
MTQQGRHAFRFWSLCPCCQSARLYPATPPVLELERWERLTLSVGMSTPGNEVDNVTQPFATRSSGELWRRGGSCVLELHTYEWQLRRLIRIVQIRVAFGPSVRVGDRPRRAPQRLEPLLGQDWLSSGQAGRPRRVMSSGPIPAMTTPLFC